VRRFGQGVLDDAGAVDRRKLGAIVFSDPAARRDLEAIIHPEVRRRTEEWFTRLDPAVHAFAVADIPLLYEVHRDRELDAVVVVACDPHTQLARVMKRDGLSEPEARRRIDAQLPIQEKVARADFVVTTDGSIEETNDQVDRLVRVLRGGQ
jgi:dephospho-CoA kinase